MSTEQISSREMEMESVQVQEQRNVEEEEVETEDDPVTTNSIHRLVLVTQASNEIATGFCIYERSNGKEFCEYFYYKRKVYPDVCGKSTDQILQFQLRHKILHSMLDFYRDILTSKSLKEVIIYSDVDEQQVTDQIKAIVKRIGGVSGPTRSFVSSNRSPCSHFTNQRPIPIRLLVDKSGKDEEIFTDKRICTAPLLNCRSYYDEAILQLALIQLQRDDFLSFKLILGDNKKYSRIL